MSAQHALHVTNELGSRQSVTSRRASQEMEDYFIDATVFNNLMGICKSLSAIFVGKLQMIYGELLNNPIDNS